MIRRKHSPLMARIQAFALILMPLICFGILLYTLSHATAELNEGWQNGVNP